jgi:hypothetical protein
VADEVIQWLLEGDPAIRWQTLRDLCDAPPEEVADERHRVATEGWGARLLAEQAPDGSWGGGLYTPKWTSTFYTLLLLRDLGLAPNNSQARRAAQLLLAEGFCESDGGLSYGGKGPAGRSAHSETCITGMGLSMLAAFRIEDQRVDRILANLLAVQMPDGGWNCRRPRGATHSSFHTTISALEGLAYLREWRGDPSGEIAAAESRGRAFLLDHRLYRSHRTGKVANDALVRFHFPPRWHYDILRGLDHFRTVDAPRDERLADGIALVSDRRQPDDRWILPAGYSGRTHFTLESTGKPSRWNTLRCLRVLRWWESAGA